MLVIGAAHSRISGRSSNVSKGDVISQTRRRVRSRAVLEKQRVVFWIVVAGIIIIGIFYAVIPLME